MLAAWLVLFGHSFDLYGISEVPVHRFIGSSPITFYALSCFFVISGYLITASWQKQQNVVHYFINRFLRIIPALAVMSIISVFIWGALLTELPAQDYFSQQDTWDFLNNIFILRLHYNLPGVFTHQPSTVFNGSLWTIKLEFRFYIVTALLGMCALLRPRVVLAFTMLLFITLAIMANLYPDAHPHDIWGFKYHNIHGFCLWGSFFFAGSSAFLFRDKIAYTFRGLLIAILIIFIATYTTPVAWHLHYIALTYIVLYLALQAPVITNAFIKKNDISYGTYLYAHPLQQTYIYLVGDALGFGGFLVICTLLCFGVGYLSWRYIESPMLRLKPRALPLVPVQLA